MDGEADSSVSERCCGRTELSQQSCQGGFTALGLGADAFTLPLHILRPNLKGIVRAAALFLISVTRREDVLT